MLLTWLDPHLEVLEKKIASKLIQSIGRIQFLEVVGLSSLSPCWLSARELSQILNTTCIPSHVTPPTLSQHQHIKHTLGLESL